MLFNAWHVHFLVVCSKEYGAITLERPICKLAPSAVNSQCAGLARRILDRLRSYRSELAVLLCFVVLQTDKSLGRYLRACARGYGSRPWLSGHRFLEWQSVPCAFTDIEA